MQMQTSTYRLADAATDARIHCAECGDLHYQNSASRLCVRCWRVQTLMVERANAVMRA